MSPWRRRLGAPCGIALLVGGFCAMTAGLGLRINLTRSLPPGIYRMSAEPVVPGGLVVACLPLPVALDGLDRGYLRHGSCPGRAAPVLKRVVAVAGDRVRIRADGVWMEDQRIQGPAPRVDSRGRSLEPLPIGNVLLGGGELWVMAPHPRSWDSRYFGPIPETQVLGAARPVWVWESPETVAESFPREREEDR